MGEGRSSSSGGTGLNGIAVCSLVAGACAVSAQSGRRRKQRGLAKRAERIVRFESMQRTHNSLEHKEESENVLEMAKKANVRLEVRPWDMLTGIAKDAARGWFVKRAEERGIPWSESVDSMKAAQPELDVLYKELVDPTMKYPEYYTQAFHGYDEGNLNWQAAHELDAATQSMCLSYYDGLPTHEAQEKYRGSFREVIKAKWEASHPDGAQPTSLLDMGCSGGFSTAEMAKAFPGVKATGIDLSPHFLSVASKTYPELQFKHRLAEDTKFEADSFDVVTLNFLLHECPKATSETIMAEAFRVLKPGGILAILDVDPRRLLELPPLRRWAFQVTEPWCKEGEYYNLEPTEFLSRIGFEDVTYNKNDPVNSRWLACKPTV